MRAQEGDWLLVRSNRIHEQDRKALILEVCGDDGGPPYRVRWFDDEHESLFFPGPGAAIHHHEEPLVEATSVPWSSG